jgi:uncharacterized iron-regulated membrane protein
MKLRKIIFWLHLMAGVVAGTVIFMMSVTGVLLAFERQIVAFAERQARTAKPPVPGAPRLGLDVMVGKAHEAVPEGTLSGITISADPTRTAVINMGRELTILVDPYTGAVRPGATVLRSFFRVVTDWHRWLGTEGESREIGRAITGACNAAFAVLVVSGFYLWWPRRWTQVALRAVTVPSLTLQGKPRDWNWHNAAGFWSASVLLMITLTGVVMSYQWANNLIYTLTGSEPPPAQQRRMAGPPGQDAPAARAGLDAMLAAATQQTPHWRLISVRLPQHGATQTTIIIEEAASWHPYPRSILTLDAATAALVKWEPYASYNLGRTVRSWVRPVHTGEAGGLIGQRSAAFASAGGAVLVYTGLAMAWRRFWNFVRGPRKAGERGSDDASDQNLGREATPRMGAEPR